MNDMDLMGAITDSGLPGQMQSPGYGLAGGGMNVNANTTMENSMLSNEGKQGNMNTGLPMKQYADGDLGGGRSYMMHNINPIKEGTESSPWFSMKSDKTSPSTIGVEPESAPGRAGGPESPPMSQGQSQMRASNNSTNVDHYQDGDLGDSMPVAGPKMVTDVNGNNVEQQYPTMKYNQDSNNPVVKNWIRYQDEPAVSDAEVLRRRENNNLQTDNSKDQYYPDPNKKGDPILQSSDHAKGSPPIEIHIHTGGHTEDKGNVNLDHDPKYNPKEAHGSYYADMDIGGNVNHRINMRMRALEKHIRNGMDEKLKKKDA
jgi:hypothetical protein